jgi:hypothetical protein
MPLTASNWKPVTIIALVIAQKARGPSASRGRAAR